MPTYEYECSKCSHRFERFQSMSDPPVKTCPECRGKVRRLIGTGAGIIFKGQGFYITDYRSKEYRDKAGKDKPAAEAPSDAGGAAKPEASNTADKPAKPAKPAETKKPKSSKKP